MRPGRWHRCGPRVVLLVGLAALLAACEKPPEMKLSVASQVMATTQWVEDVKACPLDAMPAQLRADWNDRPDCTGEDAERCLDRCRREDLQACYSLGHALLTAKEEAASTVVFHRACIMGGASSCTNRAAAMFHDRPDDPAVHACTAPIFSRSCEAKDTWGCSMYGFALEYGFGVTQDDAQALEKFEQACAYADSPADPSCEAATRHSEQIRGSSEPQAAVQGS